MTQEGTRELRLTLKYTVHAVATSARHFFIALGEQTVLVLNDRGEHIRKWDTDRGEHIRKWDTSSPTSWFWHIDDIAVVEREVFVVDENGIYVYRTDGSFVRAWWVRTAKHVPRICAVSGMLCALVVPDSDLTFPEAEVHAFTLSGSFLLRFTPRYRVSTSQTWGVVGEELYLLCTDEPQSLVVSVYAKDFTELRCMPVGNTAGLNRLYFLNRLVTDGQYLYLLRYDGRMTRLRPDGTEESVTTESAKDVIGLVARGPDVWILRKNRSSPRK
jgi:hypothetical protein